MYMGWFDPTKNVPARQKMLDGAQRYHEKFNSAPPVCLTSVADAAEIGEHDEIDVRGVNFIPRFTYYLGIDDEPAEMRAA